MSTSNPIRALRVALTCLTLASAGLIGWQQLQAQSISGFNSNAPVNYAADRIELQERQDRVVLTGNVEIAQADLRVRAARMTVAFTNAGSLKIQRMDATGGVLVTRGGESARGDVAIYDFNRRLITLVGNVHLNRNGDTLNGGRLTIDLDSGVSSVNGAAAGANQGGRVSGSFSVPERKQ